VLICMYARLISVGHPVSLHDALPIFVADVDAAVPVDLHEAVEGNSVADRDAPSDPCANIDRVLKETIAADADIRGVDDSRAGSEDRKSTRLNSSHVKISYAVFCLKKK